MQFTTTAATGLGGAGAAHRRGPARRAARALLRRPGAEPGAPRDRRARLGPSTRRRLTRLDGLRQHGRIRPRAPTQPRRARHLGDDRRGHATAPADRPRDQSGAAERGRADPGRRRDPRGAPDGARARDRGAARRAVAGLGVGGAPRGGGGRLRAGVPRRRARAFADAGADPGDATALLLALRRTTPAALERAIRIPASRELLELETWKQGVVATVAERARRSLPRLDGRRIVLAAWRCTTWSATRWRGNCRRRARR